MINFNIRFFNFYINEDIVIKKGIKTKCFKIGYCKDMEKRMLSYKVGNFNYKPLAYLTLNFTNGKEIEVGNQMIQLFPREIFFIY